MSETQKPDLTYVCPSCGQKAVLGTHFCRTAPREEPGSGPGGGGGGPGGNRVFFSLVAAAVAVLLLWRLVGPAALVLAALAAGVFYLGNRYRKAQAGGYRELVRLCRGKETADRLVEGELRRNPGLSPKEAARQALERYKRDLGR